MTKLEGNHIPNNLSEKIDDSLLSWLRVDTLSGKVIHVSRKLLDVFKLTSLEEFDHLLVSNQLDNIPIKDLLLKLLQENQGGNFQLSLKQVDNITQPFSFYSILSLDKKYFEAVLFPITNEPLEITLQRDRKAFQVLAEAALSSGSLSALCQKVIDGITETFGFEIGNITLYDQKTQLFHVVAFVDTTETNEEPSPFSIHNSKYLHSYVARVKEAVFAQDARNDAFISQFLLKTYPDKNFRALITWPLLSSKQQILGTLQLISLTPKKILEKDRILFKSIAELFALAIEKALAEIELKKLNEELEKRVADRTMELEAVNKELEAFSYSVSHDLRTPLRHISGYTELINRNLGEQQYAKIAHYLEIVMKSVNDMNKLIDDLLYFSRISRIEMKKEKIDLEQLIKQIISELEPETNNRKITWRIKKLPYLIGDLSLVRIVLINLISNAIKFTKKKEIATIEIGCKKEEKNTDPIIYIKDNGIGFDMKYYDKLFGVFQRLHTDQTFEGTGIGLATVKRIITKHGGKIWAEGVVNRGAVFYFSIGKTHMK